jgi:phosphoglycerate kinase
MPKYNCVLIRCDLNVPIDQGNILDHSRIHAILPEITRWQNQAKHVVLLSHLGRPKGQDLAFSMQPIANYLSDYLKVQVPLVSWPCTDLSANLSVAENIRFFEKEAENDAAFAKSLLEGVDHFVFDAFAVAHRSHASTDQIFQSAKSFSFGHLFQKELAVVDNLCQLEEAYSVILGGSKTETKIGLLEQLLARVNHLFLGGIVGHTFLAAKGMNMSESLHDENAVALAKNILIKAESLGVTIHLPIDGVNHSGQVCEVGQEALFDIGPKTLKQWMKVLSNLDKIVWNGPVGYYENPLFDASKKLGHFLVNIDASVIIAGGDTLAVIDKEGHYSHKSTGGGAFLYYWEKGQFPFQENMDEKD